MCKGYETTKGSLVRSLLFERPVEKLRVYGDAIRFLGLLFIIAALGSVYSLIILSIVYEVRHLQTHSARVAE